MIHLKTFCRDFCFVIKVTSCRSTCPTRGPRTPRFKFNSLFNRAFYFSKVFFESILSSKNWRGGGELFLLKNVQSMVTPTNHATAQGP